MSASLTDKEALKGVVADILVYLHQQHFISLFEYRIATNTIGPRLDQLDSQQAKRLREIIKGRIA